MIDREKVIKGLELLAHWPDGLIITDKEKWIKPCCEMAVTMLKEQEDLGTELTNAMELIHKKNERIKKLEEQIETLTKWRMNAGAFD